MAINYGEFIPQITKPRQISRPIFDVITVIMLLFPLYGMFYPLESYLGVRSEAGVVALQIPVTTITLVLITVAVWFYYREIAKFKPVHHDWTMYVFVFSAFLTCLYSPDPQFSLQRALRLIPSVGLALLFAQFYTTRQMIRLMTITFLISGPISIIVPLVAPDLGLSRLGNGYEDAWRGAHVHKNFAGFLYTIGIVVMIYAWRKRVLPRSLSGLAILIAALMAIKAQSATAIVALIGALAVGVVLSSLYLLPRRMRFTVMVVGTVMIGMAVLMVTLNLEAVVGLAGRDMTLTGRTEIWAEVWKRIMENPLLGYGYGFWVMPVNTLRAVMWQYIGDEAAHSHNSWLDIWLQLGLLGFATFVSFTLAAMWRMVKLLSSTERWDVVMFGSMFFYMMVRSISEVQFTDPAIFTLFWMVWVAASVREIDLEVKRQRRPKRLVRRPLSSAELGNSV